ncbi:MAG TPA: TonB-dependent receptor, partial [Niabella sp.]|nr:TonB-dependent receptor [Niabella sp.]
NLDNFTSILDLGEYESVVRTESYLGRVRYNFDQKYFIEGSLRRDGSSRFNPQHRWGNFGGISAAWTVSKEAFLSGNRIINDLKLRAGYGSVGNDGSAAYYAWQSLYVMNQNANLGALYLSQVGATNLIWEKVGTWGAAVEGRLFDKLNFSAEYFDKRSIDLIFPFNLPLSAGATTSLVAEATVLKNLGTLSNKGWELAADYDIISGKEFRLNFGANATFLKNKIIRLPEENRKDGIISGSKKLFEGHSIYDFWLYQFAGVDQMNGVSLYIADDVVYNGGDPDKPGTAIPASSLVTINGKNYVNNTTYAKRDWSGTSIPKVFGGITLKADWKSLTFSALFTYSLGGKMLDYTYQDLMAMSGPAHNLHVDLLRAWNGAPAGMTETSPNRIDPKGVPVVDYSKSDQSNAVSSRFLQDASYGVIKNISLGYRLPAAVLERVSLRSLSINLTAENLATFTKLQGMDPQQSFNGLHYSYFMTPRVFSLGINLGL